jgi:hypothetical protein
MKGFAAKRAGREEFTTVGYTEAIHSDGLWPQTPY